MLYFLCALIFMGWLIPNHYFPWLSAWNDAISISGLLILAAYCIFIRKNQIKISWIILLFFIIALTVPWFQWKTGHLAFSGDATITSLYSAYALLAIAIGCALGQSKEQQISALTTACVLAAVGSTGIALVQWSGALSLGIYGAELPPGSRPFGNVAQPNHLNTICFLGICALFYLYEKCQIQKISFWIGIIFLLIGMLLSQSRTGWLQIGFLVIWGSIQHVRMRNKISISWLTSISIIFVIGVTQWHTISDVLLLNPGRDLTSQMHPGTRPAYWISMLDALYQSPWWGYGWQQIGAAQQNISINHPPSTEYFEHSHNLVLDLMLWNGILLGLILTALLAFWFFQYIRSYVQPDTGWLLAALMGLAIHGMLEYPLEYAYFLIPAGILMGCIEASTPNARTRLVAIPYPVLVVCITAITAISIAVAQEWLEAETNYRELRFESARIGEQNMVSEPPDFQLLTQLSAFLVFARTEATSGMSTEQVQWMRQVAKRFGYPPVMFRYALAAGLHGDLHEAAITLQRICHIHGPQRCTEAQEGWQLLQQRFPQLQSIPGPSLVSP